MRRFKTLIVVAAALFLLIGLSTKSIAHNLYFGSTPIVFGVAPQGEIHNLHAKWQPLIESISKTSRLAIRFETASSMEDFEKRLSKGAYDIVYLNAYQYIKYHIYVGYLALVKPMHQKSTGVIVVRKDSNLHSLQALKSQTLALPDEHSFSGTMLTKHLLKQEGITVIPEYMDSDRSSFRAVASGELPAGAGELQQLNYINPIAHEKLRVVWQSKQYSSNVIAAHPRIHKEALQRIRDALISLNNDYDGMQHLSNISFKGIAVAHDNEWDDVRALRLE